MVASAFPKDVSVGVVAHNAKAYLGTTLTALLDAGCSQEQITVFDVASRDGSSDWLEETFPETRVIRMAENQGPNPARNRAIISCQTRYVLLMDSDVRVEQNTVPALRSAINHDDSVAIASPLVVYDNNPDIIQYGGTWLHFMCEAVNTWQNRSIAERGDQCEDIGCASGNALLICRDAALKVGLFDERYFMGKEDGDFTFRIKLAGYKIMEIPGAHVFHTAKSRSTGLFFYQIRNRWHFILKNYQLKTILCLTPAFILHEMFQFTILALKGHGLTYLKAISGLIKLLPTIRRDRADVARFRVRQDWELLAAGPLVIRDDMLNNRILRTAKITYDVFLRSYWTFLRKTVLR